MKKEIIKNLIKIAGKLDSIGRADFADKIDAIVKEAIDLLPEPISPMEMTAPIGNQQSYKDKSAPQVRSTSPLSGISVEGITNDPDKLQQAANLLISSKFMSAEEKKNQRAEIQAAYSAVGSAINRIAVSSAPWDQALANDIASHAMEKLISMDKAPAAVVPWILLVARNYAIDKSRRDKIRPIFHPDQVGGMESGLPNPEEILLGRKDDAELSNFQALRERVLDGLRPSYSGMIKRLEEWIFHGGTHPSEGMMRGTVEKQNSDKLISRSRSALENRIYEMHEAKEITSQEKEALLQWLSSFRIRSKAETE